MTPTDRLARITEPILTKVAVSTVLAAGFGMAVLGLTAAVANADPVSPNTPDPNPAITATLHPAPPHSESGLCNQDGGPRGAPSPPPGYCG
jgi:hypothetical protein